MRWKPDRGAGRACPERVDALVELSLRGDSPTPELARHLDECARCAEYLDWLRPASDLLGEAVPTRSPDPALKRRVMAEVRADAQAATRASRRGGLWSVPRPLVAGLAATALAAGAGTALILLDDGGTDLSTQAVVATAPRSPIAGELVREGDTGVLHLEGLPRLQGDRVYQAWLRRGEHLEPSTVFVADRTREAEATIGTGLAGADELLVTAEPAGGSAAPSSDPLLSVELT